MKLRIIALLLTFCEAFASTSKTSSAASHKKGYVSSSSVSRNHEKFVPQVAFHCGYRNQYLAKNGEWISDNDHNAVCLTGKLDILKYCRRSYPDLDVTNIVEAAHHYQIDNWCKLEGTPCKWSFWVKPYRCIIGEFESEALLVPEGCHFGHFDDRTRCKNFDHWNKTAHRECANKKDASGRYETMDVRSFSILEPCGLDMFSGVEYVCCPKKQKQNNHQEPKLDKKAAEKDLMAHVKASVHAESGDDQKKVDTEIRPIKKEKGALKKKVIDDVNVKVVPSDPEWWAEADGEKDEGSINSSSEEDDKYSWGDDDEDEDDSYDEDDEDYDDDDDDDDDDDESYDDDDDVLDGDKKSDDKKGAGNSKEKEIPGADPYLRLADPDNEHARYKAAIKRLQQRHREKVSKVMNEWSELETRYQEMKVKDPKRAESFRKEMTRRFQTTVSALEEETRDERKQLDEVHQQRLTATLNENKRENIKIYRDAISEADPKAHKILRTLEAYIRTEEKDRYRSINHYRHYLRSDPEAARAYRPTLLKRLHDIDLRINGTLDMLKDVPALIGKIKPVALEFWQTYRLENTPDIIDDSLIWVGTTNNNDKILDKFIQEAEALMTEKAKTAEKSKPSDKTGSPDKVDTTKIEEEPIVFKAENIFNPENAENEHKVDDTPKQYAAKAMKDVHAHEEAVHEEETHAGTSTGTIVLAVGGAVCLVSVVIGLMVLRRKYSARGRGFVAVDACTPEERHIAQMQVNGYENPTYSYFEKA